MIFSENRCPLFGIMLYGVKTAFPVIIAATVVSSLGYGVAIGDGFQHDRLLLVSFQEYD
jgi:hypothetical protein